jgi:hypothetical protein
VPDLYALTDIYAEIIRRALPPGVA